MRAGASFHVSPPVFPGLALSVLCCFCSWFEVVVVFLVLLGGVG